MAQPDHLQPELKVPSGEFIAYDKAGSVVLQVGDSSLHFQRQPGSIQYTDENHELAVAALSPEVGKVYSDTWRTIGRSALTIDDTRLVDKHFAVMAGKLDEKDGLFVRNMYSPEGVFVGTDAKSAHEEATPERIDRLIISSGSASVASERHPQDNQDVETLDDSLGLYAVYDGVGGSEFGGFAARRAASEIAKYLETNSYSLRDADSAMRHLGAAFNRANASILDEMGGNVGAAETTATVAKLFDTPDGERCVIGSIGDSRAYLLRDGVLSMLTIDHALYPQDSSEADKRAIQERLSSTVEKSRLSETEQRLFEKRKYIYGALGASLGEASMMVFAPQVGDVLLLTTDGIHDNLTTEEIAEHMNSAETDQGRARILVNAARRRSHQTTHERKKIDDMTAVSVTFS